MIATSSDTPDNDQEGWNVEGEDLSFLRDEGLELLVLFRTIRDREKRRIVVDIVRALAAAQTVEG